MSKREDTGLKESAAYGISEIGLAILYTLFGSYVLLFYTDVIGMSGAVVGTVILICKLTDGISDIIAGYLIDKIKTKNGHCIPVIAKWTIPLLISLMLVFFVPNSSTAVRVAYIFVTYNLFNTVMYTYVACAYNCLPTYATPNPTIQSRMICYKMLFSALANTALASVIVPLVERFGGQNVQSAWIKTVLVLGIFGSVCLYMVVLLIKEKVDNEKPPENIFKGIGGLLKNRYWAMATVMLICLTASNFYNGSVTTYYLKHVVKNLNLLGAYVGVVSLSGVVPMILFPVILQKTKITKRNISLAGCALVFVAQAAFCMGSTDNITLLLVTGFFRGLGLSCPLGLATAMLADTVEYGEWKTGIRMQGTLFAGKSMAEKIAQGLMSSIFGFFLTAIGYDGLLETQSAATVEGLTNFFKIIPFFVFGIIAIICLFWKLDKLMPQIQRDLAERKQRAGQ